MSNDPRALIDRAPMSRLQWGIVFVMVGLNALDGFDVLSISFAAPGIARSWGIDRGALGIVLSMELIGMALGSVALGGVADRSGRRRTILGCLPVMAAGMIGASTAHGVIALCLWRVMTGIGIGGMLAVTNAAVSEAANTARRSLCVVLMAAGYPLGAVIGGSISAWLLQHADWPIVFQFGALVTLCFIPLVWWHAPESIAFGLQRRGPGTLASINATLVRMGHQPVDALPPLGTTPRKAPIAALFAPDLARLTILITLAYFAQLMSFYFILKWTPNIVVDMGFAPSSAAGVLVWANVGGATGAVLFGLLTKRLPLRPMTIGAMGLSALLIAAFGHGQAGLGAMAAMAAATGFCTNAGIVGLYALIARDFPTSVRAAATGFAIGVGRGGSALAPALAGFLFNAGFGLQWVAIVMACGSVVALAALLALPAMSTPDNVVP
jgi:benzoate transport